VSFRILSAHMDDMTLALQGSDRLSQAEAIYLDIQDKRAEILAFADRMIEIGFVTVTTPLFSDLVETRNVIGDEDNPGRVIFFTVADGTCEVSTFDFDITDYRALRHIPHEDGNGLTLVDAQRRPVVRYRIN
jgi:hypothetical protein